MCFNMDHRLIPHHQSQQHYGKVNGIRARDEFLLSSFLNTDGFSHQYMDLQDFIVLGSKRLIQDCETHDFCFTLKLIWFLCELFDTELPAVGKQGGCRMDCDAHRGAV